MKDEEELEEKIWFEMPGRDRKMQWEMEGGRNEMEESAREDGFLGR